MINKTLVTVKHTQPCVQLEVNETENTQGKQKNWIITLFVIEKMPQVTYSKAKLNETFKLGKHNRAMIVLVKAELTARSV